MVNPNKIENNWNILMEIGDIVLVYRKIQPSDWNNMWSGEMDKCVGKCYKIIKISPHGIGLAGTRPICGAEASYDFPIESLIKIDKLPANFSLEF